MRSDVRMTRRAFVAACALLLAGCAQSQGGAGASEKTATKDEAAQDSSSDTSGSSATSGGEQVVSSADAATSGTGKVLVAFYSRADENYSGGGLENLTVGHTKVMAGYIADALGADTYEIVPQNAYPKGYDECCDVAKEEQRANARPAIAGALPDVSGYDVVFIGCPIWWGDEPMIVRTFLEGVNLVGKTVVPFTTHAGSGLGSVPTNLKTAMPDSRFLDGYAVLGTKVDGVRDEVTNWVKRLALA